MGIFSLVVELLRALSAWLRYQYDPEMVKRRDEIHKQLAEEGAHDEIDKVIAEGGTVSLAYFVSEFLRRVRQQESDPASGRAADLLLGVLPKRSTEDRNADPTEGF